MRVRIRLRNEGCSNHPFWWILVQPSNKNLKGRYLEKIGYWIPRKTKTVQRAIILNKMRAQYWLGHGASPTKGAHRLLEKFGFVPKYPVPFGNNTLYEKPEKEYKPDYFKFKAGKSNHQQLEIKGLMQEQMNILERKRRLNYEATAALGLDSTDAAVQELEGAKTTDIESEEADIFERKRKFDNLVKRIEKHRKETAHLKGNDLRYNIYMRKLQKLTRHDLGLDIEAYRDYVNNLKQFAHLNEDFEIYARDQLKIDEPGYRQLIEAGGFEGETEEQKLERIKMTVKAAEINNTIRKLRREAASFINDKDRALINEYIRDMKKYLALDFENFQLMQDMYRKRQEDIAKREERITLNIEKVQDKDLEQAKVSKREFDQIKMLLKVDPEMFKPSEYTSLSPHANVVDLTKYQDLPKEAKDILYRPSKVKVLYEKYWQLANQVHGRIKEETDYKYLRERLPRFPKKSTEEIQLLDKIFQKLELVIDENQREIYQYMQSEEYKENMSKRNLRIEKKTEMEELRKSIKGDLYHEDAFTEAIKKYKNMSEEEKKALKRGDDLDDIPTSDVERFYTQYYSSEDSDCPESEEQREFFETNRIDLARAFLGKNGGYTMRDLKKFFRQSKIYSPLRYDEEGKLIPPNYDEEVYAKETAAAKSQIEEEEEGQDDSMEDELSGVSKKKKAVEKKITISKDKPRVPDGRLEKYSDEEEQEYNAELTGIEKDKLDKLKDMVDSMSEDPTDEQIEAFGELLTGLTTPRKYRDTRPKGHIREDDLIGKLTKDEMANIHPIASGETRQSEPIFSYDDQIRINQWLDSQVGRYPKGYRQYENYENYKVHNPEATLQDYHETMNKEISFDEYYALMMNMFLQVSENPVMKVIYNIPFDEFDEEEGMSANDYASSSEFREDCRNLYTERVNGYLLNKRWFTLVDAIEEVINLFEYGSNLTSIPMYNSYVPAKTTIMKRPNLSDERADDLSYQYGQSRISPYFYQTAMKGHKMSPNAPPKHIKDLYKTKKFVKDTRLSRGYKHIGLFSTVNTNTNADQMTPMLQAEETRRMNFLTMKLFNTGYGLNMFNPFQ